MTPKGKLAYVPLTPGVVIPIDTATNTALPAITVGSEPFAMVVTPNGRTAYVANTGSNSVTPFRVSSNLPLAPIPVGNSPNRVVMTPNGRTIYTVNFGDNTVTPIRVSDHTPKPSIPVGAFSNAAAVTPDGKFLFIGSNNDNTVTPIKIRTNTPIPQAIRFLFPQAHLPWASRPMARHCLSPAIRICSRRSVFRITWRKRRLWWGKRPAPLHSRLSIKRVQHHNI